VLWSISLSYGQGHPKLEKIPEAEIDLMKLEKVRTLCDALLTAQKKGGYYQLTSDEADEKMVSGLDEQLQKRSYFKFRSAFGDYRSLELDHALRMNNGALYVIYRFKGHFDPRANVEIRAVIDAQDKLAGFFVVPWRDKMN